MRQNFTKFLLFLPSLFYYSLIFYLSSQSYQVNVDIFFLDKVIHFVEFGILGFLLSIGFFAHNISLKNKFYFVLIIGSVLAVLDEIHQVFVPLRVMDPLDLAADVLGVCLGFFAFNYFYKKNKWLPF
jgi:VanZ family protein